MADKPCQKLTKQGTHTGGQQAKQSTHTGGQQAKQSTHTGGQQAKQSTHTGGQQAKQSSHHSQGHEPETASHTVKRAVDDMYSNLVQSYQQARALEIKQENQVIG